MQIEIVGNLFDGFRVLAHAFRHFFSRRILIEGRSPVDFPLILILLSM